MPKQKLTFNHAIIKLFDHFVKTPYQDALLFFFILSRLNNDDFYFY